MFPLSKTRRSIVLNLPFSEGSLYKLCPVENDILNAYLCTCHLPTLLTNIKTILKKLAVDKQNFGKKVWQHWHLLLGRNLGEAVPEGEDGEADAAETGKNEEEVVDPVERTGHLQFFGVGQQPAVVNICVTAWTNFSWQDVTWAEFSTPEDAACLLCENLPNTT